MAVDTQNLWFGAYRPSDTDAVYTSTDPTNAGALTGPYAVGLTDTEITQMVPYGTLMLICKPEGLYTITTGGTTVNLSKDIFRPMRHDDNFRNACLLTNGSVLLPLGEGGMWEVSADGVLRDVSFRLTMPEQTYLHGNVINLCAVPDGVYALVANSTTVYILYGEWLTINGVTDYRWHVLGSTTWTGTAIDKYRQFMFVQGYLSGTDIYRRLWISRVGSDTSPTPANWFLSKLNDRDDAYTTDSTATFDTDNEDANLPQVDKNYVEVRFTTKNLTSGAGGHTVPVDYSLDSGTTWVSLGTLNTSPTQTLSFASGITGKTLMLRPKPLLGTPTSPLTSPEVLDLTIVCQVRPDPKKVITLSVYLADEMVTGNGGRETRANTKMAQLRTWNAQAAAVTVKDSDNTAGRACLFLPGTMQEVGVAREVGRRLEKLVQFKLLEV